MAGKVDFKLYAISDRRMCAPRVLPLVIKQAVQSGLKAVQLREKDLFAGELFRLAEDVQGSVSQYGAKLLVNDRADIAASVGASGVHLTEHSMPVWAARRILGEEAIIGASVHTKEAAQSAEQEGADFVVFGSVFETRSHAKVSPKGPKALEEVVATVSLPVFGLGGITPENVSYCMEAGAFGVAVRSALFGTKSVRSAVRAFKRSLGTL